MIFKRSAYEGLDPLEILGADSIESLDELKSIYRQKAMQFHPDVNKDPGAEEEFKKIQHAYREILSNPETYLRKKEPKPKISRVFLTEYTNGWTQIDVEMLELQYTDEGFAFFYRLKHRNGQIQFKWETPFKTELLPYSEKTDKIFDKLKSVSKPAGE